MGAGAEAVCIVAKMFHHMLYDRNYTANQLVPPILRPAGAAKITLREFWPTFLEMQDSIANMQWDGITSSYWFAVFTSGLMGWVFVLGAFSQILCLSWLFSDKF